MVTESSATERSCPRCDSPMVRTVAKTGPREGQPLWRCSDFACPILINIDDGDVTPHLPVAGESAQAQFERERAAHADRIRHVATLMAGLGILVALAASSWGRLLPTSESEQSSGFSS